MNSMEGCAVVGIGETPVGKLEQSTSLGLHALAVREALDDASIDWQDVDGLITAGSFVDNFSRHSLTVAEYLGIAQQLSYNTSIHMGGASTAMGLMHACMAIEQGICSTVVVAGADNQRSGLRGKDAVEQYASFRHPQFEVPFGLPNPGAYAMIAHRYMFEYGVTSAQMAEVAVTIRNHAGLNPRAVFRQPITVEDVLNSKMICEPLHLLDCSPISDGGGALVVTSLAKAKANGLKPVKVAGYGMGFTHDHVIENPDLTTSGCKASGKRAFEKAGIVPADIDFAELYDCYTIAVIMQLEELGFCARGEGGSFVENGNISLKGSLPVCTHGGLLSHCHLGAPAGVFHLTEAVRQLRGESGPRQVPDPHYGLVHAEGGILSANCTVILGGL